MTAPYTYLITYPDGMLYHGSRTAKGCHPGDSYMGSSKVTPEDGVKTILTTHDNIGDCLAEEVRYHEEHEVGVNKRYYNKSKQTAAGFSTAGTHTPHSEETKAKISAANNGKESPLRGRPLSDEHRVNIGLSQIGENNHMYGRTGRDHPNWGKPVSVEQKSKMSTSAKNRDKFSCTHCGKKMSKNHLAQWHGDKCKHKENKDD